MTIFQGVQLSPAKSGPSSFGGPTNSRKEAVGTGVAQMPLRRPRTEPKQVSRYARADKLSLSLVGFPGAVVPTPLRRSVTGRADPGGRPQARKGPMRAERP